MRQEISLDAPGMFLGKVKTSVLESKSADAALELLDEIAEDEKSESDESAETGVPELVESEQLFPPPPTCAQEEHNAWNTTNRAW